jgi:hypothetical protein
VIQQICGGVEHFYPVARWNKRLKSREHSILLMVRRMRLALPFYGEVYGQYIRRSTPLVAKNTREEALSNSRLLSHWTALMMRPNCVET